MDTITHKNERAMGIQEFLESAGFVKELVDSGITKLPKIFLDPNENLARPPPSSAAAGGPFIVPVIDLKCGSREEIVEKIRQVGETWGVFQIVNHGIPVQILDNMLDDIRRFNEQPAELKGGGRERNSRFYSYLSGLAEIPWRDSQIYVFSDGKVDHEALPQICRKVIGDCFESIVGLKDRLSELLSEALGLRSDFLGSNIKDMRSAYVGCHYYPVCPEPNLTMGTYAHTDPSVLTILLQDNIGGLQVLHQNVWVDVPFVPESLLVNFGDFMELITNGKFKSSNHRVLAQTSDSRTSSAFFFSSYRNVHAKDDQVYGPLKELISEENPPIYKTTTLSEYIKNFSEQKAKNVQSPTLSHLKLYTQEL